MILDLGSFTGIRIGVATTKGFCDSLDIKSIGVSSLECLAYNIKKEGFIIPIISGTNDTCFYAIYFLDSNNNYIEVLKPTSNNIDNAILDFSKYASSFKQNSSNISKGDDINNIYNNISFVGNGCVKYKEELILASFSSVTDNISEDNNINSYHLGLAGLNLIKQNTIAPVLPLYLKKPQAQIELEKKSNIN